MSTTLEPQAPASDPISFEVIRHKLQAITEEQAITLKSVSGSPVVTDATDFNNGIYLADGSIVTMGPQVLFHTGTMSSVIRSIVDDYADSPGIHEGDMFILNDPYKGAVHQPDVSIVAPVFHAGRHVAWAGSCAHQLDVGGMSFGSWSFAATEVQQEAMLLPGVKIVESGEIRKDVWQMIMGMTRLPMVLGLDLKAMIAANNVAIRRLREVMDRYGTATVEAVMRTEIDASEHRLRARLRELPDGIFRAVDFLEHDGHTNALYEIRVAVEKRGDELTFDLSGSSPQAPGFINCTRSGLVGALFTALLPILAPDIRWNAGVLRPVTVKAPDGVICNATWPAPVSSGTVSAVWVATNVAATALSRLAACSPTTAQEAAAVTKGSMMVLTLSGQDRDGGPFGTFLLDSTAGGGGAYADHDGLNASGDYCVPRPSIANVESNEAGGPYLYLYRRLLADTGGAGRQRGGATVGLALTPHDVDKLDAMLIGHGVEVPNSTGLFGGLEGSCNATRLRPSDGRSPVGRVVGPETLGADGAEVRELGSKPGFFELCAGDVFAYSFQGGGGYGDPIDRDPEEVRADVEAGLVSAEAAERLYGVVLRGSAVDAAATRAGRAAVRAIRVGGRGPRRGSAPAGTATDGLAIGDHLVHTPDGTIACRCGEPLGTGGAWKSAAVRRIVDAGEHGRSIRLHEELELREHACPGCGALLESEVARRAAPDLVSIELAP
jgi:N-methylhydantoinase B